MLIAAIIPEVAKRKARIHRIAALLMSTLMLPFVLYLAVSSHFPATVRTLTALFAIYMITIIALLIKRKRHHPKMLLIQGSYAAVFHLAFIAATYIK